MDNDSLDLLEKAIQLYNSAGKAWETPVDGGHLEDHALLDSCLIRDSMEKHGILDR